MSTSPFLESIRTELRTRRYSIKTEKVYLYWIKQFILFNDKKHPQDMGNAEIERFLNHLAVNRQVSAATQNQALCAIIYVYKHIIRREISDLRYSFTKREQSIPTVLTHEEATNIISHLSGQYWLMASLLYGGGLRINEVLKLRIKDVNIQNNTLFIFRGKGKKDRYTLLPKSLSHSLDNQFSIVKARHLHYYANMVMPLKIYLGSMFSPHRRAVHIHMMAIFVVIIFTKQHLENNCAKQY